MIRMIQSRSAEQAKAYFSDALIKSDYYLNDQELPGRFAGHLALRLSVDEIADKETFFHLCENINPQTGESLTPRNRDNRTAGYDINFHVPKSVSILHALAADDHILAAFQTSVHDSMRDIEADSMTRVRKKGVYEDRPTGELIWTEFIHQTARPVDGSDPDPHLHCHCFTFNATWDEQEQRIKAGQFREIKRDMPYYQARFHKRLSDAMHGLGYEIRRTAKSFEILGVPQGAIDLFSKRTNEIGEYAKEKGITGARAMGDIGAKTRSKKQKGLSMDELRRGWRKQIKEQVAYQPCDGERPVRYAINKEPSKELARDCIDYSLKHAFERVSVMSERRLLESAYRHSIGKTSIILDNITKSFDSDSRIIRVKEHGRIFCTRHDVLFEEQKMVELARSGQGRFLPLCLTVNDDENLNSQQNEAIAHLLTTCDQVSIIRGAAGTGKTTIMRSATRLIEQAGKRITVVAPTAEASRGVLVAEGFTEATTVAKLLSDQEMQAKLKGQVLWVDEAGLLGTRDMSALLCLAKEQNARIILGGDTRQHASVVRGDALRILNTLGGIKTAEVSQIHRQKNYHYRDAVEKLSQGDIKAGFDKLVEMASIKEVNPLKPNDDLVEDYMAAVKNKKSVLIVSPTHQQGESVTNEVRERLRAAGLIGEKELSATKLTNLNLTEAQKSDWQNFERGQIIQFNQNVPKIKRGSIWHVGDVSENAVTLHDGHGGEQLLPFDKAAAYDLYKPTEIGLSKGDKIRITRNSFDGQNKRLNNGQSLEVAAVTKSGAIKLVNKVSKTTYILDKYFGHLDHAYCTTSHSSQGKTVDEVFISQPAATFSATDAKQFYVSVSRGRDNATIYTDDKNALLIYAEQIGDRQSALELVGNCNPHLALVLQIGRNNYFSQKTNDIKKETQIVINEIDRNYEPEF